MISDSLQTLYPSIVIAPQCPEQDYWAPVKRMEWTYNPEDEATDAMIAVEKLMQKIRKMKTLTVQGFMLQGCQWEDLER